MKHGIVGICLFLAVQSIVFAQLSSPNKSTSSDAESELINSLKKKPKHGLIYFTMGSGNPQKEFQSNIGTGGSGFLFGGGYSFEPIFPKEYNGFNASLVTGMDIGYITLTRNKRPASYFVKYDDYIYTNSVVPINVFARAQFNIAQWIFPYGELIGGMNVYSATTDGGYREQVLRDGKYVWETRTDEVYSKRNVFWNYGVGAGMMIKIVENISLPNSASSILLDIKARYHYGVKADYQKVINVDKNGTTMYESYNDAGTDMLFVQAGIAFRF